MKLFAIVLGVVGVLVVGVLIQGMVLMQLWVWFVTPFFPALGILEHGGCAAFVGIALLVNMLTRTDTSDVKKERRSTADWFANTIGGAVGYPLAVLIMAWVVRLFVVLPTP